MRKLLILILTLVMISLLCISVFAVAVAGDDKNVDGSLVPPEDYGDPIQETTYFDEDLGGTVTERFYFVPDSVEKKG